MDGLVGWIAGISPETLNLFVFLFFARFSVIDTSGSSVCCLCCIFSIFLVARCFPLYFFFHIASPHDFPNPIIIKSHVSARFVAAYFYFYP